MICELFGLIFQAATSCTRPCTDAPAARLPPAWRVRGRGPDGPVVFSRCYASAVQRARGWGGQVLAGEAVEGGE